MNIRQRIVEAVGEYPPVQYHIADRFFQSNAIDTAPDEKPFAMYTMGVEFHRGYPVLKAYDKSFQVWVHDVPGEYTRIEQILDAARKALFDVGHDLGFLEFRFVERSQELNDPALGTICRYDRWQAIVT